VGKGGYAVSFCLLSCFAAAVVRGSLNLPSDDLWVMVLGLPTSCRECFASGPAVLVELTSVTRRGVSQIRRAAGQTIPYR
jgi:hypothetical protein